MFSFVRKTISAFKKIAGDTTSPRSYQQTHLMRSLPINLAASNTPNDTHYLQHFTSMATLTNRLLNLPNFAYGSLNLTCVFFVVIP